MQELIRYELRAKLGIILIGFGFTIGMASMLTYHLVLHGATIASRVILLSCMVFFYVWSFRLIYVYGIRIEVEGENVVIKRFNRRWLLNKRTIHLKSARSNGFMSIYQLSGNGLSFRIDGNFTNYERFINELKTVQN